MSPRVIENSHKPQALDIIIIALLNLYDANYNTGQNLNVTAIGSITPARSPPVNDHLGDDRQMFDDPGQGPFMPPVQAPYRSFLDDAGQDPVPYLLICSRICFAPDVHPYLLGPAHLREAAKLQR